MRREIRGHMANVDDEDETVWSLLKLTEPVQVKNLKASMGVVRQFGKTCYTQYAWVQW